MYCWTTHRGLVVHLHQCDSCMAFLTYDEGPVIHRNQYCPSNAGPPSGCPSGGWEGPLDHSLWTLISSEDVHMASRWRIGNGTARHSDAPSLRTPLRYFSKAGLSSISLVSSSRSASCRVTSIFPAWGVPTICEPAATSASSARMMPCITYKHVTTSSLPRPVSQRHQLLWPPVGARATLNASDYIYLAA